MRNFDLLGRCGLVSSMAIGLTLAVSACMPSPNVRAAQTLACNKAQIESEAVGHGAWVATGCGKTDVLSTNDGSKWTSLREQAAFQLSCGAGELVITQIGNDTFGVVGCGKKASYLAVLGSLVLQSATEEGAPQAPAAAASTPVAPAAPAQ